MIHPPNDAAAPHRRYKSHDTHREITMADTHDSGSVRIDLVQLAAGTTPAAFEAAVRAAAPEMVGSLLTWTHDDWYALAPDVGPALTAGGAALRPTLESAGVIGQRRLDAAAFTALLSLRDAQRGTSSAALRDRAVPAAVFVDPPEFSWTADYQGQPVALDWHVGASDIPAAWAQLAGPHSYADIVVGHIDTGYTEHPALGFGSDTGTWLQPDLGRNYWKDRAEADTIGQDQGRWYTAPEFPGPRDNLSGSHGGHGTRTSSVLSGLYAPADGSIAHPFFGAAPGARVIPYRITDSVIIDHVPDLLAKAIDDAVGQGAQVLSISLGALRRDARVARAVEAAYRRGVIVCAAAGQPLPIVIYPGRFKCVVTCGGATTPDGRAFMPWRQSARGPDVDICGPADHIRRPTTVRHRGADRYLITGPGDGTSFATALCAGIAVLWLARHRGDLDAAYGTERWARAAAFKALLKSTAFTPSGWPTAEYGAGIYQAGALLSAALPKLTDLTPESA